MKSLLHVLVILLTFALPGRAEVKYSGLVTLTVPFTEEGIYVNPRSWEVTFTAPATWDSQPWINLFYGGSMLATNSMLTPVIQSPATGLGDGRLIRLSAGEMIDASRNFADGDNGSDSHMGLEIQNFRAATAGYVGFALHDGPSMDCGWMRVTMNNNGTGTIHDWAYDNSGVSIAAGFIGVPEPGACALSAVTLTMLRRRRRPLLKPSPGP